MTLHYKEGLKPRHSNPGMARMPAESKCHLRACEEVTQLRSVTKSQRSVEVSDIFSGWSLAQEFSA